MHVISHALSMDVLLWRVDLSLWGRGKFLWEWRRFFLSSRLQSCCDAETVARRCNVASDAAVLLIRGVAEACWEIQDMHQVEE